MKYLEDQAIAQKDKRSKKAAEEQRLAAEKERKR
jgi:hypothetical protein